MMRRAVLAAALVLLPAAGLAQTPAGPNAAATAAPVDPAMLARAKDAFVRVQSGTLDRSQFDDAANMNLDVDTVKAMSAQLAPLGPPQTFVQASVASQEGATYYTYAVGFKNGTKVNFVMAVDADGKIAGIQLQPAS